MRDIRLERQSATVAFDFRKVVSIAMIVMPQRMSSMLLFS
jgi:hypothetical protein